MPVLIRGHLRGTPLKLREQVYFSHARSHLEHCSTVWNPYTKEINQTENIQRLAARFVQTQLIATNGNRCVTSMLTTSTTLYDHPSNYQIVSARIPIYSNSFLPRTIFWWNSLPRNVLHGSSNHPTLQGSGYFTLLSRCVCLYLHFVYTFSSVFTSD